MTARSALNNIESIPKDEEGPVFAEPWQAQVFALAVSLNEKGAFRWEEWVDVFSQKIAKDGAPENYYDHWLSTLEELLDRKRIILEPDRQIRERAWDRAVKATPHGEPIILGRDQMV